MTINIDNFSLYAAAAGACAAFVAYLVAAIAGGRPLAARASRLARVAYWTSVASIAYASVYMMQQILSLRRYDIAYIHDYSAPTDALIYRISAFWAGQEGSLLLWALIGALIGIVIIARPPGRVILNAAGSPTCSLPFQGRVVERTLVAAFWCSVQAFLCLLLLVGDPFRPLADFHPAMVGLGLNPLLKNPWMAIHPPVIFIGYAALAVPAAFAVQALLTGDATRWARACLPWALFGWLSLSAGLILGMVWSYEVLGWGGYWGWDPVENASLVPWITSTALVHGLVLQRMRNRMSRGNLILALGTFVLVLYATFLTRSGVLSDVSVHSFSDLGAYSCLLAFLLVYAVGSLILLVASWRSMAVKTQPMSVPSRDAVLIAGIVALVLFALVVLAGTSYPLFANSVLDPKFYTHMSIPVAVAVVLLVIMTPLLGWTRPNADSTPKRQPVRIGATIAHAGVVLMFAGVVLSCQGSSKTLSLIQNGKPDSAAGWQFTYDSREKSGPAKEYINLIASRGASRVKTALAIENSERGAVRSPYILGSMLRDVYISPVDGGGTLLTPTASVTDEGWISIPDEIPGTTASVSLIGMQVESNLAKLQYNPEHGIPATFEVSEGQAAKVDGRTFEFRRLLVTSSKDMSSITAGVDLSVSGRGIRDRIVVEVSTKPFIRLLWLGTALILVGGGVALWRRRRENGILSDSS